MQRVVLAPAGIAADRLAKLREAFAKLAKDKTYKTLLTKLGENDKFMEPSLQENAGQAGQGLCRAGEGTDQINERRRIKRQPLLKKTRRDRMTNSSGPGFS